MKYHNTDDESIITIRCPQCQGEETIYCEEEGTTEYRCWMCGYFFELLFDRKDKNEEII